MDGFIALSQDDLSSGNGVNNLNTMLQKLFNSASGDGISISDFTGYGSPEGVIAASVGATYRRIDGGAGTSYYIKSSGSGNTGWTAVNIVTYPLSVANGGTGGDFSAAAQGDIPFFSATGVLSALVPGTAGYLLQTNGAGANPSYIPPIFITPYASGTFIETYSMQFVQSTSSVSFQKLKELSPMLRAGIISVSFDYASSSNAATQAQIYLNGIATGTLRSDSTGAFTTYTQDITVISGDILQIYGHGDGSTTLASVCNLKIKVTVPSLPQDETNLIGRVFSGAGVPNSRVGDHGDIYLRTDGGSNTTLYVKETASWTAK